MTYAQIVDWVNENFDPKDYKSYVELEQAVKSRFEDDGMFFPPGAAGHLQDFYQDSFPEQPSPIVGPVQDTLQEYLAPPESVEPLGGLITPSDEFFEGMDKPQPVQPLPPIFQEYKPSRGSFFGNIGKAFRGAFKRLFGR